MDRDNSKKGITYDPNQYQAPVVKIRSKARRKITQITVKPKPNSKKFTFGIGFTIVYMLYRTFAPQDNPLQNMQDNVLASFGHLQGTSVTFDWNTLADPAKIQKAMKGIPGSFVVADSEGAIIASKNGDELMSIASVAKVFTTVAMLEKNPDKYFQDSNFENLKEAFEVSDNLYFDNKMDEVGGRQYIQNLMRKITGDDRVTIANGSGCPGLTKGSETHGCSARSYGASSPTKMSAFGAVKVQFYLEKLLASHGKKYSDLAPQKNGSRRYGSGFNNPVFAKTGTINELYSLMGSVDGPNGEKVKFAAFTPGDASNRSMVHIRVLNSVFPK